MAQAEKDLIAQLPFVKNLSRQERKRTLRGRNFWAVRSTGDGLADSALGTRYAKEFLRYEKTEISSGSAPLLPAIVADFPSTIGLMEISFLHTIGMAAARGYGTVA